MYTDEDLDIAIEKGVLTKQAVEDFRALVSTRIEDTPADEERFRLVTGFGDIFVVLVAGLFISASVWLVDQFYGDFGICLAPFLVWGLSEIYVRQRRMALVAVSSTMAFAFSIFASLETILREIGWAGDGEDSLLTSLFLTIPFTWLHWQRFRVPITIAIGVAILAIYLLMLVCDYGLVCDEDGYGGSGLQVLMWLLGVGAFALAMYWDISDLRRVTRNSDIAFWLHLIAAPLIVHPIFEGLGFLDNEVTTLNAVIAVAFFLILTTTSLLIDRRGFMVSSLFYVIYVVFEVMSHYDESYRMPLTILVICAPLLLLSAFWHQARNLAMDYIPDSYRQYLPVAH